MYVYNQGDGIEYEAWFETAAGVPTIPPNAYWRLRCLTTNQVLQDWTAVGPEVVSENGIITGVRVLIEVDGERNEIQDSNNRRETKQLQVMAGRRTARQKSEFFEYAVANGDF